MTQTRLRLVFNPQATELQIRTLLQALGARVVDGPLPGGAYIVEVAPADPKAFGDKLRAARANGDVLQSLDFAAP
jgi:hypothetical protein